MRTNTKINRHEKIAAVLLSGNPVSPNEILMCFKDTDQEKVLYRLSTNIYNIRKDGGVIRVHKDGRKVVGYQLMNPEEFDMRGRYIGKPLAPKQEPVPVPENVEKEEPELVTA
jgi:hypothetical protein